MNRMYTYVEDSVSIVRIILDALTIMEQPDEEEDEGEDPKQLSNYGNARGATPVHPPLHIHCTKQRLCKLIRLVVVARSLQSLWF